MREPSGQPSGRRFVGFGFGPIQAGLFAYEALRSGTFARVVIAEVDAELVRAVREAGGLCRINVAHPDGITTETVGPVCMLNPAVAEDRRRLIEDIAGADELATALPSVEFYRRGGDASVAAVLAAGLGASGRPRIVYTAENHNQAAEILEAAAGPRAAVQFLNTVIGKMSGVIADEAEQRRLGLAPLAPGLARAVLVEEFNRILITRVTLPGFRRGLAVFEEKPDLLPFEDAKLYGHNAIHALLGFLAHARGCRYMSEAGHDPALMQLARDAFLSECGAGLIHRHAGVDPLFTREGFQAYADDLLVRMVNPYLSDPVARVIRDLPRKLGWDDRLVGAVRLARAAGVHPIRLLAGVGLACRRLTEPPLRELWPAAAWTSGEAERILAGAEAAVKTLIHQETEDE